MLRLLQVSAAARTRVLAVRCLSTQALVAANGMPDFERLAKPDVITSQMPPMVEELRSTVKNMEARLIEGKTHPTWRLLDDLEKASFDLKQCWAGATHLTRVQQSDELRAAVATLQPQVVELLTDIAQSRPLLDAMKSMTDLPTVSNVQRRILDKHIQDAELKGCALPDAKRDQFKKLDVEQANLEQTFQQNATNARAKVSRLVEDFGQVSGLPRSILESMAESARKNGHPGATAESGPWLVTLPMHAVTAILTHAHSRSMREWAYRTNATLASEGEFDNTSTIKRLLEIRHQQAQMLGFPTHGDVSTSRKMAGTVEAVNKLIEDLKRSAYPAAVQEHKELAQYAESNGLDGKLQPWDVAYFSEKLMKERYDVSANEIQSYLPLSHVLKGVLSYFGDLFGIDFRPSSLERATWNNLLQTYAIVDRKTDFEIAHIIMDPYARPSEKMSGAWMDACVGKSMVMNTKPIAHLVCNFEPPSQAAPESEPESYLTFRDLETLVHELGHALQHTLTRVTFADTAGINNIEWDAVELPSQFLENWCYRPEFLRLVTRHRDSGDVMPDSMINNIINARTFMGASQMMRQLYFSKLDMELHTTYDPTSASLSPFEFSQRIAKDYTVIPPIPEDRFLCNFLHIFSHSYSAGYWSYKWAEVLAADAFSAFTEAGLEDKETMQRLGQRFRDTVLSLGGSMHPAHVFEAFRGRPPKVDALLAQYGLEPATASR